MSATTLNYDLKLIMHELVKDDRWAVLTVLILHSNENNRCYPSMERIAELATNGNPNRASAAKQWLLKHGAIELVPFKKRYGKKEEGLPRRQHVYHLTGVINLDGKAYPYLYFGSHQQEQAEGKETILAKDGNEPEVMAHDNIASHNYATHNQSILNPLSSSISNSSSASAEGEPPPVTEKETQPSGQDSGDTTSLPPAAPPAKSPAQLENARRHDLATVMATYSFGVAEPTQQQITHWRGKKDSGVIGQLAADFPDLTPEELKAVFDEYERKKNPELPKLASKETIARHILTRRATPAKAKREVKVEIAGGEYGRL